MSCKYKRLKSPALRLIRLVWENHGQQQGKSNIRDDHAIDAALCLAIRYGLRFEPDDFKKLADWFKGYAAPISLIFGDERHYALACGAERGIENKSAAIAFEHWKKRKPFLIRESRKVKTPTRVYVGFQFDWHYQLVTCTSFKDDGSALIACTYEQGDVQPGCVTCGHGGSERQKIRNRIRITHDAIREYHASIKEAVA